MQTERTSSPPPDRALRAPAFRLPVGTCDTHVHVFGPQERFPLKPGRRLEVEDCTLDDLLALHDTLGVGRALLVQSFQHGNSYEYLLHALGRAGARLRGVASPAADVSDLELDLLERAGVIGARFAYPANPTIDPPLLARLAERGWQGHFMLEGSAQIAAWRATIEAYPNPVVIEHMANPPADRGIESPEFRFVMELLERGNVWVKLSPRFSNEAELPFADVLPFIRALVERWPQRLLWGSDWPHPNYFKPMPNDADLVDLSPRWIEDPAAQHAILVRNPGELFGFDAPSSGGTR